MAVGFVNKTSTVLATSGTTTVITTPTGIAVGHRLIAVLGSVAASTTITPPAGWTLIAEYAPTTALRTAAYFRNVTGTEAANYTWTFSVSGRMFGYIVAYSGCDLTAAPTYGVKSGTVDSVGPHAAPTVVVPNQGWLVTAVGARQSPGTAGQVPWSINVATEAERWDITAANTSTGAQLPSAFYDSNGPLAASTGGPTTGTAPLNKYNALYTASGAMRVGATCKKGEKDSGLPYWQARLVGMDWMRVFPDGDGLPPSWDDERFDMIQHYGAEPFVSTKIDGDNAKIAELGTRLQAMPAWITRLWLTDRHEPEGDNITPAQYIANYKEVWAMVNGLPAAIRARIKCGPVLTRQWTENTAGRTYKTHDPGPAFSDFFGVDMYMNSWKSGSTAATAYTDAATFLSKFKAYRYDATDVRPRMFPEFGAIGLPDDTTGAGRAAWMQAVHDQLVTWTEAAQGWPFLGYLWWNAEGKSGDSIARLGIHRWFQLDRIHTSGPLQYTVTVDGKPVVKTDPEGSYGFLPDVSTGGGGGSTPTARQVTSSVQTGIQHVWAFALAPATAVAPNANPWTTCGCPMF